MCKFVVKWWLAVDRVVVIVIVLNILWLLCVAVVILCGCGGCVRLLCLFVIAV